MVLSHKGREIAEAKAGCTPRAGASEQKAPKLGSTCSGGIDCNGHRLHKPGVAGSSPAAAILSSDESLDQYHADKAWYSKSQLWDLVSLGPKVFQARHVSCLDNSRAVHPALSRGTLVHEWAEVGADAWWGRVVEIPESALGAGGRRTKATEEFESEALFNRPDAILLKADEAASYRAQFAAILANPVYAELSDATIHRELSVRWADDSGLRLKCRPDALTLDCVWDIKTTKEPSPLESFWKSVIDYGYAFQQVHYLAGLQAAGIAVDKFVFLVTSTVPPYACHGVTLPQRLVAKAEAVWRKAILEVRDRLELDHWLPADSGQITELFVPERYMEERRGYRPSTAWVQ